jgi:photosystem II stability/assembly factor-like uncharacterized protein
MKKIITLLYLLLVIPIYSQWIPLNSGTTEMLNDVYCITQDIVVVVGNNGTILKTTDGGTTWIQKTSGTSSHLLKVQFPTTTIGYAVGSSGILLKTINQGETWSIIDVNVTNDLHGLTCLTENIFFISGDNGLVKKTTNGGVTFDENNINTNQIVIDVQFPSELVGYSLVGSLDYFSTDKMLYKTIDGGNSWAILLNESVDAFYFLNEDVGFINKANNSLNKTIDGGLNLQSIGNSNLFESDIFSLNENQVWDTGATPLLCNCTFQCISKREILQDTSFLQYDACNENYELLFPFLESIHFANETNGFAVGFNGRILKNSNGINEYLSTNTFSKKQNLTIYPNPATSLITVSLTELPTQSFEIEITNILGKKVYTQFYQPINNVNIDTKAFSKGVYFLTLIQQEKKETKKIIID